MKKIIILVIALLSTGIVFSAINNKKEETAKPVVVKVQKGDFTARATGDNNTNTLASAD
ncbi:hypothetical protein KXQ82_09415 [Mucilaginibacter sp. HMF5004]|uniref:hypothetical protein n=1 Tax=Mucilaginibacter rivuli TaxID=2857527 RepID=UPI001C5D6F6E|nr:hypothetical protein [Mucilaginibacter rivuli]MBW4889935.1 hypothetical protein [Mucilaginibacter rivuli]